MSDHVAEGLTIIFEGPQRSGKTMAMVAWALDSYQRGRRIFSNIQLGFAHEPMEFRDLQLEDGSSRYRNGHIAIDELNFFFDGRRSMAASSLEFSAFLLQQKKQGCFLTGTTHDMASLDLRMRHNYDYVIRPEVFPRFPEKPQVLKMVIENGPLQKDMRRVMALDCRPLMGLYDTFAVYDPFKGVEEKPRKRGGSRPASRVQL